SQAARSGLSRQERHSHDRHAEFRSGRGAGPGNLVNRRLPQEIAECVGGGFQGVVRQTLSARVPPQAISTISACEFATSTVSPTSFPNNARASGETCESVPCAGSASSSPTMRKV